MHNAFSGLTGISTFFYNNILNASRVIFVPGAWFYSFEKLERVHALYFSLLLAKAAAIWLKRQGDFLLTFTFILTIDSYSTNIYKRQRFRLNKCIQKNHITSRVTMQLHVEMCQHKYSIHYGSYLFHIH